MKVALREIIHGRVSRVAQAGLLTLVLAGFAATARAGDPTAGDSDTSAAVALAQDESIPAADRITRLRAMTIDHPRNGALWVALGEMLESERKLEEALGAFDNAVEVDPTLYSAWQWVGILNKRMRKDLDRAEAAFRRALELGAPVAPTHNELGVTLALLERPKEALTEFDAAIAAAPDWGVLYNNSIKTATAAGEPKRAREYFLKSLDAARYEENAVMLWCEWLASEGDHKKAAEDYALAIAKHPNRPRLHFYRGLALAAAGRKTRPEGLNELATARELGNAQGDRETARQSVFEIFRIENPDENETLQKAVVLIFQPEQDEEKRRDRARKGVKLLDPIIAKMPDFPNARLARAAGLRILDDRAQAQVDLLHVLTLDPNEPNALNHLAMISSDNDDKTKAVEYSRKAVENAPRDPVILMNAGFLEVDAGNCDEARKLLERVERLVGSDNAAPLRTVISSHCK